MSLCSDLHTKDLEQSERDVNPDIKKIMEQKSSSSYYSEILCNILCNAYKKKINHFFILC